MKSVNSTALALINSGQFILAQLYTITLADGTVIRLTGFDVPVQVGATTWGLGAIVSRGSIRQARGLEVGTLDVTLTQAADGVFAGGLSASDCARTGKLDRARVVVEEAIIGTPAYPVTVAADKVWKFTGRVMEMDVDGFEVALLVKSWLAELEAPLPRNLHQVLCLNKLGDAGCGVNRAALQSLLTVTAVSGDGLTLTVGSVAGRPADWFALGRAIGATANANQGESRTIRAADNAAGTITLLRAMPVPVQVGHQLTLVPGCDRRYEGGCTRFGNTARFRATRWTPQPAALLGA